MEANEIMTNEEVTDVVETTVEDIATKSSDSKFKVAAFGGLTVLIGGLALQYIIIPTVTKIRAKKKNSKVVEAEFTEVSDEKVNNEEG